MSSVYWKWKNTFRGLRLGLTKTRRLSRRMIENVYDVHLSMIVNALRVLHFKIYLPFSNENNLIDKA